jgi:predicted Fe-S protein YdhL (DUF1289 family)
VNGEEAPASPCISVCLLDDGDVCVGCYRTADEITDWFTASPAEKREVLRRSRQRELAANPIRLV